MFGAMPSDFMVFDVSERPKEEEDEDQTTTSSDVNTSEWDVNHRCVGVADGKKQKHFSNIQCGE